MAIYLVFNRVYGGFMVGTASVIDLIFSQIIAIGFTVGSSYAIFSLLSYKLVNPVPLIIGFFGFSMYRNDNKGAEVKISSFPDASIGKSKITGIYLKENNTDASILGIKIGDDDSIAYKQLEKYKFKIVKSSNDTIIAKKHRLRINVSIGDNYEIKEISVTVDTTNVLRVQY
jgi:hypothetical protein